MTGQPICRCSIPDGVSTCRFCGGEVMGTRRSFPPTPMGTRFHRGPLLSGAEQYAREQDAVRARLHDDPFVTNDDYGRLLEEAADADERRAWSAEKEDA